MDTLNNQLPDEFPASAAANPDSEPAQEFPLQADSLPAENRDPVTALPRVENPGVSVPTALPALSQRMARNLSIYMLSQFVTWIVSFVAVSLIPRMLGEQHLGELDTAGIAIGPLGFLFALGIEGYMVREMGRDPSQTNRLLQNAMGLRLVLYPLYIVTTSLTLLALHASPLIWKMASLMLVNAFIAWLSEPLRAVLYAQDQAKRIAGTDFLTTLPGLVMLPFLHLGPLVPLFVGLAFTLLIAIIRVTWLRGQVPFRPAFHWRVWKELALGGIPYMALGYITILYLMIGVLLIRHYVGTAAVGEYGQTQKLQGTFLFIPTALSAAILPSLLRLSASAPEKFRRLQGQMLSFVMITVLPISVGVFLLAPPLCRLLYGAHHFVHVPLAAKVLAFNVIPLYVISTLHQFLVAQGRAAAWARYHLATVALFGLFGLILTPLAERMYHNGVAGVVLAGGLAEMFGALFALMLLRPQIAVADFAARMARAAVATLIMGAMIWSARNLFLAIPALLGAATFIALVVPLRLLTPEQQAQIIGMVRSKLRRAQPS